VVIADDQSEGLRQLQSTQCQLKLHQNPANVNNWDQAAAFCAASGGPGSRLASFAEYCPTGENHPPAFGTQAGDQWAAILDEPNGWVQVGTWPGNGHTCVYHSNIANGEGPGWGTDDSKASYESNYLHCYECPQISGFQAEFCWRESYFRGGSIGIPTADCTSNRDSIGLFCFSDCGSGYSRSPLAFTCNQDCPSGWIDRGLLCEREDQYGRGLGYGWLIGDPAFQNNGQISRCETDHGIGKCESCGAIVYPKCADGWEVGEKNQGFFHCQHCRRSFGDEPIQCEGIHGMLYSPVSFKTHCTKRVQISSPGFKDCDQGQGEFNLGLCYSEPCREGFEGAGPTCWVKPPENYVRCGMGAAKDDEATCESVTADQVTSVLGLAMQVFEAAVLFASGGSASGVAFVSLISRFKILMGDFGAKGDLWSGYDKAKGIFEQAQGWIDIFAADFNAENVTPADRIRIAAQIVSVLDVTDIVAPTASVIAAYSWPLCDEIRDDPVARCGGTDFTYGHRDTTGEVCTAGWSAECADVCWRGKCRNGGGYWYYTGSGPYTCYFDSPCGPEFTHEGNDDRGSKCTAGWSQHCPTDCYRAKCQDNGGTWISLDYSSNPYTCYFN
jgi:hypothetical protein